MAIGNVRVWAAPLLRAHGLTPFREILPPGLFADLDRRPRPSWTVLVPEVVFWLMATVALGDGSMAGATVLFWSTLRAHFPRLPIEPLTEEAFCIARLNLPLRFFRRLFAALLARFDAHFDGCGAAVWRWHGFRPLGVDGSELTLPASSELREHFPTSTNQNSPAVHPQARLVGLVDLWTGLCRQFRLLPLRLSEQRAADALVRGLGPWDLLLADRNFPGLGLMAAIRARGTHFLMRLPSNRYHRQRLAPTPSRRSDEGYATLRLSTELARRFPLVAEGLQVRILTYQVPGFRASRLITSLLDTTAFPHPEIVALYHDRWRQETAHREWKHTLQINNLRSHSMAGILKEILVQLTLNNAIRWLMAEAAVPERRPVDLQFLAAKRLVLAALPVMATAPAEDLPRLARQLSASLKRRLILVRPDRSYPRKFDERVRHKGHGKTAIPARLPRPQEQSRAAI